MKYRRPLLVLLVAVLLAAPAVAQGPVSEVYKQVKGSVVVIETSEQTLNPQAAGQLVSVGGMGSGVLISRDGLVMTAAHVVQVADEITVTLLSGETIPARVSASEPAADLALLQLERRPGVAQVAELGDSDKVQVGDEVFVVGAPLGMTHSLTVGHVSGRRRDDSVFGGMVETEMLQTDAAINQGNSGGPMFNKQGQVVGIVSHIISQGGGFEGLGFVITSNMAKRLLLDSPSMWSGIQGRMLSEGMAAAFNIPQPHGMLVERVARRSVGEHLGIRGGAISAQIEGTPVVLGGDVILEVMGVQVGDAASRSELRARIGALKNGEEIAVKVLRAGEVIELKNFYFTDLLVPKTPGE